MLIIMQNPIKQAHLRLLKSRKTIATAESCTAGLLSALLTQLPDSAQYFILGITTYSNRSKKNILKIPASIIRKKGAVSQETALLMAQNVRKLAQADLGISITGIAGPTGATSRKPVGTVFIALSAKNKTICKKFIFKGNRSSVRKQASLKALLLLKNIL
ncbi:MAG: CinA family protein [Candidatus Omnitrophota bacterium]